LLLLLRRRFFFAGSCSCGASLLLEGWWSSDPSTVTASLFPCFVVSLFLPLRPREPRGPLRRRPLGSSVVGPAMANGAGSASGADDTIARPEERLHQAPAKKAGGARACQGSRRLHNPQSATAPHSAPLPGHSLARRTDGERLQRRAQLAGQMLNWPANEHIHWSAGVWPSARPRMPRPGAGSGARAPLQTPAAAHCRARRTWRGQQQGARRSAGLADEANPIALYDGRGRELCVKTPGLLRGGVCVCAEASRTGHDACRAWRGFGRDISKDGI